MRRLYLAVVAAVVLAIPMASMAQDRKPESKDQNRGDARSGRLKLGKMRENLDKLVKEGKVSKKDADARFEEAVNRYKESLQKQESRKAPRGKGGDKAQPKSKGKAKAKGGSDKAAAAREKIIEAVKAGKLSREDAGKKLRAMKAKDGQKKDAKGKEKGGSDKLAEARRQIVEAVKAGGKISREEAGKKWKDIELSREDAGKKMKALMAKAGPGDAGGVPPMKRYPRICTPSVRSIETSWLLSAAFSHGVPAPPRKR